MTGSHLASLIDVTQDGAAKYGPVQIRISWHHDCFDGEMTNWGTHGIDQVQRVLGIDDTGPIEMWPIKPGYRGDRFNDKVGMRSRAHHRRHRQAIR